MTYLAIAAAFGCGFFGAAALAQSAATVESLPKEGIVTLQGHVESVEDERSFVLRDDTGTIDIDIESGQSLVLKQGDAVTVTGQVDRSLFGSSINASDVEVNKNAVEQMSEAIDEMGLSGDRAANFRIDDLPESGMVRVSGTITDVNDERSFTLEDQSGSVDIEMQTADNAAVVEGAQVTVTGRVEEGLTGRTIHATKLNVTGEAMPSASNQ